MFLVEEVIGEYCVHPVNLLFFRFKFVEFLENFATSICKIILQVVISTDVLNFCTGIYFHIDTGTQLILIFVKREDRYFQNFDKFNKMNEGKTRTRH